LIIETRNPTSFNIILCVCGVLGSDNVLR